MPRHKQEFTQEELERPTNFIVVLADKILDTSPVDIERAQEYCDKFSRRSIVLTTNKSFDDIQTVYYQAITNATKPVFRRVDTRNDAYSKVYRRLIKNYKNGLMICYADTLTDEICSELAILNGTGLDLIIHRDAPVLLTPAECSRVTFFRIHYSQNFSFSNDYLGILADKFGWDSDEGRKYGSDTGFGLALCQFIVNTQWTECQKYYTEISRKIALDGITDFIDTQAYDRQLAFHVYYDMVNSRILGLDRDKCIPYISGLFEMFNFSDWGEEDLIDVRDKYFPKEKNE